MTWNQNFMHVEIWRVKLNLFRIEESSHNGPSIQVAWVFPCFWGREGPLTLIGIVREEKRMPAWIIARYDHCSRILGAGWCRWNQDQVLMDLLRFTGQWWTCRDILRLVFCSLFHFQVADSAQVSASCITNIQPPFIPPCTLLKTNTASAKRPSPQKNIHSPKHHVKKQQGLNHD